MIINDDNVKYKLYSSMDRIIHPTISKNNISRYKIILSDDVDPVEIFYPERVSKLDKVIIFIHGISTISTCFKYQDFCRELALKSNSLVISIIYNEKDMYLECLNNCARDVVFLIEKLEKCNILRENISLIGDSVGSNIVIGISRQMDIGVANTILMEPIVSPSFFTIGELDKNDRQNITLIGDLKLYYEKALKYKKDYRNDLVFPMLNPITLKGKTLIIVGSSDIMLGDVLSYSRAIDAESLELKLLGHGFIGQIDFETEPQLINEIDKFLNK